MWTTTDLTLGEDAQRRLLEIARRVVDGAEPEASLPVSGASGLTAPIILTVFHRDGRLLVRQREESDGEPLDLTVVRAAEASRANLDEYDGGDLFLHLQVVTRTARFPNFGIAGFFDAKVYEPRVTGLAYGLDGRRVELDPLQAVTLDLDSKRSRQHLARELGLDPRDVPGRSDLLIEVYRVLHFGERYQDHRFSTYFRGHRFLRADQVTGETVRESLELIGDWYEQNVIDSEVTYRYHPRTGRFDNSKRTIVRSTMAVWILNRLARFLERDVLKALGEETIRFYLERYFQMEKSLVTGSLQPSPEPLANGFLVRNHFTSAAFIVGSILERDELENYEREVELLMKWCLGFRREDGSLWTEWAQNQFFMPGQLLLVLASLYGQTEEKRYRTLFEETFGAYERPYLDLMDLGPTSITPYAPGWATQGAAAMFLETGDERYLQMIWRVNDRVVLWYEDNARHQVHPDYEGILAPKSGFYGNNSITAAALESLVDGARVAAKVGDHERFETYWPIVRRTAAYLMRLQYRPENTYYVENRNQVVGGFKTDLVTNLVWCDNVWHAASAFMKICRLVEEVDDGSRPRPAAT